MSISYELAQLNSAEMQAPLDDPAMADFVAAIDRINAIADRAPGFVWRLRPAGDDYGITDHALGANILVNISVWQSADALRAYVYRSDHGDYVRARRKWAKPHVEPHMVLWWVPDGHRPSLTEGIERLQRLRANGPSAQAFTFKTLQPPPNQLDVLDAP